VHRGARLAVFQKVSEAQKCQGDGNHLAIARQADLWEKRVVDRDARTRALAPTSRNSEMSPDSRVMMAVNIRTLSMTGLRTGTLMQVSVRKPATT
jgi:hypothetical protein